jgi:hypothetical protein
MILNPTQYPNNTRTISGLINIVFRDDSVLLCNTSLGAVGIQLAEIPNNSWNTIYKLYVKDQSGNASTNNITINAPVGFTVNGASSVTINADNGIALIRISSSTSYLASFSFGTSANNFAVLDEGILLTPSASSMDFTGDYVTATSVGNAVTVNVDAPDTGWVDLEGFEYQSAIGKPQCRKIGKQIHFRGIIIIPLSNDGGTTLIPIVNASSYVNEWYSKVFTSTNGLNKGVTVNPDGTITFNLNSPVIPTSVLPAPTNFDGTYVNQLIGVRAISEKGGAGNCLTAFFQLIITSDKKLRIQTVIDFETPSSTAPNYLVGSSPFRFITSYIREFDQIPNYIDPVAFIDNAKAIAPYTLESGIYPSGEQWALDCDASQPDQIGGFVFRLDGLMSYI